MAGNVNHEYHILEPDIWPLVGSFSALVFTTGLVFFMHDMAGGYLILGLGIAGGPTGGLGLGAPGGVLRGEEANGSRIWNLPPRV